jgi:prepilin-type N-terminal cleavage/methylation domain-containing protein
MLKFSGNTKSKGLTLIEIIVVLFIITALFTIGIMNYSRQIAEKKYMTSVDKLMSMIERANSEGKAFGMPAENYNPANTSSAPAADDNHTYRVSVITQGIDKSHKSEILENVNLSFNFDFRVLNRNEIENFKGVLLVFSYLNDSGNYIDQVMIPISQYGAPYKPGSNDPISDALNNNRDEKYEIVMTYKLGGKDVRRNRILIDKYLGTIEKIREL